MRDRLGRQTGRFPILKGNSIDITSDELDQLENVFTELNSENLKQFLELYLTRDVLLLALPNHLRGTTNRPIGAQWLSVIISDYQTQANNTFKVSAAKTHKLRQTFHPKQHYVAHYRKPKLFVEQRVKVTNNYQANKHQQSKWLASYVELHTKNGKKQRQNLIRSSSSGWQIQFLVNSAKAYGTEFPYNSLAQKTNF